MPVDVDGAEILIEFAYRVDEGPIPEFPEAKPTTIEDQKWAERIQAALIDKPDDPAAVGAYNRKDNIDEAESEEDKAIRRVKRRIAQQRKKIREAEYQIKIAYEAFCSWLMELKIQNISMYDHFKVVAEKEKIPFEQLVSALFAFLDGGQYQLSFHQITRDWLPEFIRAYKGEPEEDGLYIAPSEMMMNQQMTLDMEQTKRELGLQEVMVEIGNVMMQFLHNPTSENLKIISEIIANNNLVQAAHLDDLGFEELIENDLVQSLEKIEKEEFEEGLCIALGSLIKIYYHTRFGAIGGLLKFCEKDGKIQIKDFLKKAKTYFPESNS